MQGVVDCGVEGRPEIVLSGCELQWLEVGRIDGMELRVGASSVVSNEIESGETMRLDFGGVLV